MGFKVKTAKELLDRKVEELPMLLEDIFPQTGLVALAGGSDTGKSSLLRQLGIAICRGEEEFIGLKLITKNKSVMLISTEDDEKALSFVLKKQMAGGTEEGMERFYIITEGEINTLITDLDDHLITNPCDVVFVDAVSDLIPGDMNSQTNVRQFLNKFSSISKKHECLIVFLHHLNKSATEFASKNQLNGSQAFEAKMRAVLILGKKDDYSSLERWLQVAKGNYTPTEQKQKKTVLLLDEQTLTFTKMGEQGIRSKLEKEVQSKAEQKKILELSKLGRSIREIENELPQFGFSAKRTKISEILKEETTVRPFDF